MFFFLKSTLRLNNSSVIKKYHQFKSKLSGIEYHIILQIGRKGENRKENLRNLKLMLFVHQKRCF